MFQEKKRIQGEANNAYFLLSLCKQLVALPGFFMIGRKTSNSDAKRESTCSKHVHHTEVWESDTVPHPL